MESTLTLTSTTLNDSNKFERHRKLREKAERLADLAERAYSTHKRKMHEVESELVFNPERTFQQGVVALNQYHRCWKYYKVVLGQIFHQ